MTVAAAPKFYLHIRDKDRFIEDPEGVDAASVEAACLLAVEAATELLAEGLIRVESLEGRGFDITDEHGRVQAHVPFAQILSGRAQSGSLAHPVTVRFH